MRAIIHIDNGVAYSFDISEEAFSRMLESWDECETITLKHDGKVCAKVKTDHIVSIEREAVN